MRLVMKRAGAGTASANRMSLLRDTDGDGIADLKSALLKNLDSPLGMALVGDFLYVANSNGLMRFPYKTGDLEISDPGVKVLELPAGPINHHWTKNILASLDERKFFITIGSNSNVAEHGLEAEKDRASIWEYDIESGTHRVFASTSVFSNGVFIGQHGSWNRKPHSGYKVIFVPFSAGQPSGEPVDVLTGFLSQDGKALGRPVGVALDRYGALLVADDVGNTVWRVSVDQKK